MAAVASAGVFLVFGAGFLDFSVDFLGAAFLPDGVLAAGAADFGALAVLPPLAGLVGAAPGWALACTTLDCRLT
jgi:hypothetical protein